jgi:hypothetical protein
LTIKANGTTAQLAQQTWTKWLPSTSYTLSFMAKTDGDPRDGDIHRHSMDGEVGDLHVAFSRDRRGADLHRKRQHHRDKREGARGQHQIESDVGRVVTLGWGSPH